MKVVKAILWCLGITFVDSNQQSDQLQTPSTVKPAEPSLQEIATEFQQLINTGKDAPAALSALQQKYGWSEKTKSEKLDALLAMLKPTKPNDSVTL
jgi:hypothetical protein